MCGLQEPGTDGSWGIGVLRPSFMGRGGGVGAGWGGVGGWSERKIFVAEVLLGLPTLWKGALWSLCLFLSARPYYLSGVPTGNFLAPHSLF